MLAHRVSLLVGLVEREGGLDDLFGYLLLFGCQRFDEHAHVDLKEAACGGEELFRLGSWADTVVF